MKEIHFQNYNGIAVWVHDDGDFAAQVNGSCFREACFAHLKARIEAELKADAAAAKVELPCIGLFFDEFAEGDAYTTTELQLVGLKRNDSTLKFKGHDGKGFLYALPNTEANRVLLQDKACLQNQLRAIDRQIKPRVVESFRYGGRIQPSEYPEQITNLQERYAIALAVSEGRQ